MKDDVWECLLCKAELTSEAAVTEHFEKDHPAEYEQGQLEQTESLILEQVAAGLVEIASVSENGELRYRLTEKGEQHAQKLLQGERP